MDASAQHDARVRAMSALRGAMRREEEAGHCTGQSWPAQPHTPVQGEPGELSTDWGTFDHREAWQ